MDEKIYLKTDIKFKNIVELLKFGFDYETNRGYFARTYSSQDYGYNNIQCREASRSFRDLLALCKTYFPNTTEKKLLSALIYLYRFNLCSQHCGDVNEFVFFQRSPKIWVSKKTNKEIFEFYIRDGGYYFESKYNEHYLIKLFYENKHRIKR